MTAGQTAAADRVGARQAEAITAKGMMLKIIRFKRPLKALISKITLWYPHLAEQDPKGPALV
jgi:hypothetical protein